MPPSSDPARAAAWGLDQRLARQLNPAALMGSLRAEPGRSGLKPPAQQGRRPKPLRLTDAGLALIGVELSADAVRGVTCSLQGEVLEQLQAPLQSIVPEAASDQQLASVAASVATLLADLAERSHAEGRQLLGIGLALPGPVASALRTSLQALDQGALAQRPLYCQSEANLVALSESQFGAGHGNGPLVALCCGLGVRAGVILGERLITGGSGAFGELGHSTLHRLGRICSCGRQGCAEAYIGLRAVASEAGLPDVAALRAARQRGDASARTAFVQAGEHLGVLLQNIWASFDPAHIVLSGEAVQLGGSDFVAAAQRVLGRYAAAADRPAPALRLARYGEQAAAVGAAAYALYGQLHPHLGLAQPAA